MISYLICLRIVPIVGSNVRQSEGLRTSNFLNQMLKNNDRNSLLAEANPTTSFQIAFRPSCAARCVAMASKISIGSSMNDPGLHKCTSLLLS